MATRISFVNEKSMNVIEDLDTVARSLTDNGSALVHRTGKERRLVVFAAAVTYLEEYDESKSARVVAF